MANTKSAIKRAKTNEKRRQHNASRKSAIRTAIKAVEAAVENKDEKAAELLQVALKKLDKAAAKGLLHKNTVARQKSRLAKKVNSLSS